jgi:hypothetical protein
MNGLERAKRFRRVGGFAVVAAGLALGLLFCMGPVIFSALSSGAHPTPGTLGDVRFNEYVLEHGYRWLMNLLGWGDYPASARLWDPPMFYPARNVLAYSDTLLGSAYLYWPWRLAGLPADNAYLAWLAGCLSLDYLVFYRLLRRHFGAEIGTFPAVIGAFVFAFGTPRQHQLNHPQLAQQFLMIAALDALLTHFRDEAAGRPRRGPLFAFFIFFALQFWASFYLGWFLAISLAIALGWALCARATRSWLITHVRLHGAGIAAGFALMIAGLSPLAWHYGLAAGELGVREFGAINPWIPHLKSWLYSGTGSWLYDWLNRLAPWRELVTSGVSHEHAWSIGWITTVAAIWGLFQTRGLTEATAGPVRWFSRVGLTWFFAVTKILPRVTLWAILFAIVPLGTAVRAIGRIGLITLIPLSIGVAISLSLAIGKGRYALAIGMALICVLEQGHRLPFYDRQIVREEVEAVAANVLKAAREKNCRAFYYAPVVWMEREAQWGATPGHREPWRYHVNAMWAALETGIPSVNGYSGNLPPGMNPKLFEREIRPNHRATDEPLLRADLEAWLKLHALPSDAVCWIQ